MSDTFTHGYFVFPVFLWLIWRNRDQLTTTACRPDLRGLIFISGAGALWLLSKLAGIQVGEHLAFALILVFTICTVIGFGATNQLKFPLAFLLFLAPVGEELVPVLMEITADMTVWAIRNTGIPIHREGLFFSLPSGNWSVVEACSGIRYLIASSVLGSLYAYLTYVSFKLRLLFFVVSLLVPILANSARAYIIVMLGHFSGNKLATGVDHLVYGWVFFGIVMFVLFSIGAWLIRYDVQSQETKVVLENNENTGITRTSSLIGGYGHIVSLAVIFAIVASWPVWSATIDSRSLTQKSTQSTEQFLPGGELTDPELTFVTTAENWQPRNAGHDLRLDAILVELDLPKVRAIAFVYEQQRQGKEMVSSGNVLVRSKSAIWRLTRSETREMVSKAGTAVAIKENQLSSTSRRLIVWQWYRVGNSTTSNPLLAKLFEVRDQLLLRKSLSINYMLVVEDGDAKSELALKAALEKIMN